MENKRVIVRDFLYVDVERLYSLYSQVFEGVIDQIVQSYVDEHSHKDLQKGPILKGSSLETQIAEVSHRTESKFLYDHMYNRLEEKMHGAILEAPIVSSNNYREVLGQALMIKIRGAAEIEDYSRINVFMEKINPLAEAIAYAITKSDESTAALRELEDTIRGIKDRNKKVKAREQIKAIKDPKHLAKEMGLSQDEQLLKYLRLFVDMFYPEGFEITVVPAQGVEGVVFRGVLDKRWLRVQPDLLRALYGGFVESNWTMVGQVTYLPGGKLPQIEHALEIVSKERGKKEESPSMRDPFRNIFRASMDFERMFLESKQRIEVIVCPLAIYREMVIPVIHNV